MNWSKTICRDIRATWTEPTRTYWCNGCVADSRSEDFHVRFSLCAPNFSKLWKSQLSCEPGLVMSHFVKPFAFLSRMNFLRFINQDDDVTVNREAGSQPATSSCTDPSSANTRRWQTSQRALRNCGLADSIDWLLTTSLWALKGFLTC